MRTTPSVIVCGAPGNDVTRRVCIEQYTVKSYLDIPRQFMILVFPGSELDTILQVSSVEVININDNSPAIDARYEISVNEVRNLILTIYSRYNFSSSCQHFQISSTFSIHLSKEYGLFTSVRKLHLGINWRRR